MLNRRHLRIKVLQNIFAWHLSTQKDIGMHTKLLMKSVDSIYEMYIHMLSLIVEVTQYTANDAEERLLKHLPSSEDLNPNTKLLYNKFALALLHHPEYVAAVAKYRVNWFVDIEYLKTIFVNLKASAEYQTYLSSENDTLEDSKEIIKFIFRKLILKNKNIIQVFEDKFINWEVDKEVMQGMVAKTFKNFTSENHFMNKLEPMSADWAEDSKFVTDLFVFTLRNDNDYQSIIAERTKNWESDRIALMDTILMKMAICEMLNFPSIPVKVTINEYLEISKIYSTPKSNTFINGILDNILSDFKKENKIIKIGRGLVDE